MRKEIILLFLCVFLLLPAVARGAGVAARQREMKEKREEIIKKQIEQRKLSQAEPARKKKTEDQFFAPDTNSGGSEHEIGLRDLWKELETTSLIWKDIADEGAKLKTVEMYISWYAQQGVKMRKPPEEYVFLIDDIAENNSPMLNGSFRDLLKMVAIIEYDFDNGMDKDSLARQVLGEREYQKNRQRLGGQ
ncbi:MAG: hypothetical protein HQL27_09000 [Candidatus Omnitrophica bacterium]|nr:hypothetical protein [Candidatus Omnitrophota bacterium]